MGRSTNSFTSWVGHAAEISGGTVTLPEKDLWVAVLCRAVLDACKGPPQLDMSRQANISHKNHYTYDRDQARHFFLKGGKHFREVCEMAGRDPDYVQAKIRKVILRKNGWNVDVPITSHYRQGPKRGRKRGPKKHLTGNSYYAAMGKKGGRPKLYG
jgi:hypothetical protein